MWDFLVDVFGSWYMMLMLVLLIVLVGVFIYLRKTSDDDE